MEAPVVPRVIKVVDDRFAPRDEHGRVSGPHERRFLLTVPITVRLHRPSGGEESLAVGDLSAGSLDVALNVLNFFVPPEHDGLEMVPCALNYASATAHELHEEFCGEFLTEPAMGGGGGEIPTREITAWIARRRPALAPLLPTP